MSFSRWKLNADKAKSDSINAVLFPISCEAKLFFNFVAIPGQKHS